MTLAWPEMHETYTLLQRPTGFRPSILVRQKRAMDSWNFLAGLCDLQGTRLKRRWWSR
jgi:hypothetical protein